MDLRWNLAVFTNVRMGQSALGAFLSVCLVNWPAILVVSVSQGRNYHCVRTHFVGLTLLRSWNKQDNRICFARENFFICVAKACVMIDV